MQDDGEKIKKNSEGRYLIALLLFFVFLFSYFAMTDWNNHKGFLRISELYFCIYASTSAISVLVLIYFWFIKLLRQADFILMAWVGLAAAVFLSYFGTCFFELLNSALDKSPARIQSVEVTNFYFYHTGRFQPNFHKVIFKDWKDQTRTCETAVSDEVFNGLRKGELIDLRVHDGYFGFEWTDMPTIKKK